MSDKFSRIANVSSETRESILRKSVRDLPNSPSAAGMSAFDLKRYFYQLVTDGNYSALAELQRVIDEVNSTFGQIEASDDDFAKKLEEAIQSISKKAEATALEKEISDRSAADSALQEKIESAQGTADEALEKANSIDLSGYYTKTDVDERLLEKVDDTDLEEEKSARESADTEIKASIESVSNSIPKNTSQLTNDSGFVTNAVADLVNYYTKTQVDAQLSQIPKFSIAPVDELPTENISTTTVYLVKDMQDTGNLYTEYIYVDGAWEKLGSQKVDFTGYATEEWVALRIADFVTTEQLNAIAKKADDHIADKNNPHGVTAAQIGAEPAFEKKSAFNKDFGTEAGTVCQGNDSRLSDARPANGGNAATVGGKSPSDFATSEQGGKADTAYQKPSTGIPESDLSQDVQDKLNKSGGSSYTLPIASATTLGGVQPETKTTGMTQTVGVDETGKLWTTDNSSNYVVANPTQVATAQLEKLKIGSVIYEVSTGAPIINLGTLAPDEQFSITTEQADLLKTNPNTVLKCIILSQNVIARRQLADFSETEIYFAANVSMGSVIYTVTIRISVNGTNGTIMMLPFYGIPEGGTNGQVLGKTSNSDYAVGWINPSGGDSSAKLLWSGSWDGTSLLSVPTISNYSVISIEYTVPEMGSNIHKITAIRGIAPYNTADNLFDGFIAPQDVLSGSSRWIKGSVIFQLNSKDGELIKCSTVFAIINVADTTTLGQSMLSSGFVFGGTNACSIKKIYGISVASA